MATVQSLLPEAIRFLVATACRRGLVTYSDVAANISTHHRVVPRVLWDIHHRCVDNGWPPLTAVVVGKATRKPGEGFLRELLGKRSEASEEAGWRELLEQVYAFDWNAVLPGLGVRRPGQTGHGTC